MTKLEEKNHRFMGNNILQKDLSKVLVVLIVTIILSYFAKFYEETIYFVLSSEAFLSTHLLLEVGSIIMSFCIFAITYYTYEQSKRLSVIIIAYTFFMVTILDIFHTFTYKGMPFFLTESSPAKATAFWIIARMTVSLGMLMSSLVSQNKKVKSKHLKGLGLVGATLAMSIALISVTYYIDFFPPLYIEGKGLTALKIILEYIIIIIHIITATIYLRRYKRHNYDKAYFLMVLGLVVSIFSELAFCAYVNVYDMYNLLGHLYKIVAYYIFFRALFVMNVHKPYQKLSIAEKKLNNYVDNLEKIVEERTAEIALANNKISKNLDYARHIQTALMTTEFPKIPGMDFASKYLPCEKVGGDFYNVFRLDEDNIGIVIGDVAGHGVSAAMVNVFINQNMKFRVNYEDGRYRILTPRGVLMNLYHVYNEMTFPEEIYVVLFYGIYNIKNMQLSYASAGMNTNPLILNSSGDVNALKLDGFPICRVGEFFKPNYMTNTIKLDDGDVLIFYSDGLGEIDREMPNIFSNENIMEYIKGMQSFSAQDICDELADAYHTLLGDRDMLDDVTILVIKTPHIDK